MTTVLAVAPHPDDETLGCGGTLLRHVAQGDSVHWLVVTAMTDGRQFPVERISARREEIRRVAGLYGFAGVHELGLPTCELDRMGLGELVPFFTRIVMAVAPQIVYLPFRGDAHSDHKMVFDAAAAALKWFRAPGVNRVLAYRTLSETGFNLAPEGTHFHPNVYVDISSHLEAKIAIMREYAGEMGEHPFPRSETAIKAQAVLDGTACGVQAAEAFMLLKEIV